MKHTFILLFFALITNTVYGQQTLTGNNYQKSFVDSAIFYFKASKTAKGVDSLVFEKGLRMVESIPVDVNSIKRIEMVALDFNGIRDHFYYQEIHSAIFTAFENAGEYYKEIDYGKALIKRHEGTRDPDNRTIFLIALSQTRVPFRVSDKLNEGFEYYTAKLKKYLQKNDSGAISICYYVHGGFYNTKGLTDLAIYYYKKSIQYLNVNDTALNFEAIGGRASWMNNTGVVGAMYNATGDYRNGILYSRAALNAGIQKGISKAALSYCNKNIAYAKIMLNEPDSVMYFLNEAIKPAWDSQRHANVAICYQVKGIYYLQAGQLDSSAFYFEKSKWMMSEYNIHANTTIGTSIPGYYLALVRIKQNRFKEASELLNAEIPRLVNLREELIKCYKLLVEVYFLLGDVKKANESFNQYIAFQEELTKEQNSNRKISFETEQKINDAESTITNLNSEKEIAALSRNYLIGIAALLLVIALVIYRRFRITRAQKVIIEREKQRSEILLLNILPSEVAEELKAKGSADAKHFEDVTIMFTDFKNFTKISEKLSPTELVNEIHTCFEAFDDIISKHNIEKIKTIGDSYMCAGGLPVMNITHAEDMVNAALEIQKFMCKHSEERTRTKKEVFEIRIGIHSGPVVAGIVGTKKFAYDIWGDAVNIASRMESSGEAGKINISGTTYEMLKNKFTFVHRGKITAKNKGEIDMYFVN